MIRLTTQTLNPFRNAPGVTFIFFGDPAGKVSLAQAYEFGWAWARHSDDAAFGYIDAKAEPLARAAWCVKHLPTVLMFRDGRLEQCFEGFKREHKLTEAFKRQQNIDIKFAA